MQLLRPILLLAGLGLIAFTFVPLYTSTNLSLRRPVTKRYDGGLTSALEELHHALQTMQDTYFQLWLGTWPSCIDWTAAVMGTYVSASLYSLTRSLDFDLPPHREQPASVTLEGQRIENEINKYFSQAVAYYFGEDSFALRQQAYDDMLWVVLGWLETIRFIDLHIDAHYPTQGDHSWYGKQFSGAFGHRARVFYDLAKRGWDENDCGGGMTWNPRLQPYKNAITNQLFISASVSMYLNFPGDDNTSPFMATNKKEHSDEDQLRMESKPYARPHDPEYLLSAVQAYDWLVDSKMTNEQGLYVDGFHVSHYPWKRGGVCDQRNEMVYTYNQGVILSGLRGLWESTGRIRYLEDGHELIRNVIKATGYDLATNTPGAGNKTDQSWHGLGRNGILEDYCDSRGTCSQDAQNFKGIFFHHMTIFCEKLPFTPRVHGISKAATYELAALHSRSCFEYSAWVARNAVGALQTRNNKGQFGMWWGDERKPPISADIPHAAEDYRNGGLGDEKKWGKGWEPILVPPKSPSGLLNSLQNNEMLHSSESIIASSISISDVNDRGRGRTVETQGAGVAVVRAMWEFVFQHTPGNKDDDIFKLMKSTWISRKS